MKPGIDFAKKHWKLLIGAFVVIYGLLYLSKRSHGAAAPAQDLSGGSQAITNLSAAASLQNAQVNGQVEVAQLSASVAATQIAAQLAAKQGETAAQLALGLSQTQADVKKMAITADAALGIQRLQSDAQVAQTKIQAATIDNLAAQAAGVKTAQLTVVKNQIDQIFQHSKHASQDYTAFAPIISLELGLPQATPSLAGANAASRTAAAPANTIAAVGGGISSILSSLFQ